MFDGSVIRLEQPTEAAAARRKPVSVNITDLALLTGSEISPLR